MFMDTRPFVIATLLSALPLVSIAQTEESVQTDPAGTQAAEPMQVESDTETLSVEVVEEQQVEGQIIMQSENTILADNLIGATVYSETDESIGDINNLIISLDGQVKGVVIGIGGFLGIGEKAVAIEMRNLSLTPLVDDGQPRLVLAKTREELEAAPEFQTLRDQRAREEAEGTMTDPAATVPPTTDPVLDPVPAE